MDKQRYVIEERIAKPKDMPWKPFVGPLPRETARAYRKIYAENSPWYRYRCVPFVEPEPDMQEAVAASSRGRD